jgi:hypothetical protein
MSSHYLIDLFATLNPAILAVVTEPANGQTIANGAFIVRLPDTGGLIDPGTGRPAVPTDLTDLLTKKYQGILSFFAGYGNIHFDDLLDTSGINLSAPGLAGTLGERSTIALNPGATLTSNMVTLGDTPTNAILTWEVFQYLDADPSSDRLQRTYQERPTTATYTTAQVSFNNGGTYLAATDSGVFNIPPGDQGDQMIVQITNATSAPPIRIQIGSWAVIY